LEVLITWNQTGPQGSVGPVGPQGPQGPQGAQGLPGSPGAPRCQGFPVSRSVNPLNLRMQATVWKSSQEQPRRNASSA
jgi:hypothetical protein